MDNLRKSFLVKGNSIVGFSDKNFSTLHIGCVIPFAGNTDKIPHGYLLANGASYKVADYPDLYAVIGNTYGGDAENFNVPNSDTVQPPALTMVYIIKAFHTNEGVDSGVSDDVINYINNSNSYSTEETLTGGKWINGKPIYRKIFKVLKSELDVSTTNTNSWSSPAFALSIDEIVDYDVLAFRNNGMVYKSVDYILNGSYTTAWAFSGFLFKESSEIRICAFMGDALYNDLSHIYGILYYTKS